MDLVSPNDTAKQFGYPDSLIAEFDYWYLLARPVQSTLGAMVLVTKSGECNLAEMDAAAFTELKRVTSLIDSRIKPFLGYKKINFLMLMMVDPHVHFHIFPRYDEGQQFNGVSFVDPGWPGPPELTFNNPISDDGFLNLRNKLRTQMTTHGD